MSERRSRFPQIGGSVWWRQLRVDAGADLVIAVTVAITAFVVGVGPRVLERASGDDLAETIATATPEQRNLSFRMRGEIGAGPPSDPFLNVAFRGGRLRTEHIPEAVTSLLSGEQWVVDTPEYVVSTFPGGERGPFPTTFRFRYQAGIEEHARFVDGSPPSRQDPIVRLEGTDCPDDADPETFEPEVDVPCERVVLPVFDGAVTRQTADDMMVEVGDLVTLRPSPTDVSFRTARINTAEIRFVLRISGIVELDDPRLEYWYADSSLHRPRITENPDFRLVSAVGLISPDQYREFRDASPGVALNFSWRYLVDPDLVRAADAAEVRDAAAGIAPPDVDVVTQLPDLLGTHLAQRRLAAVLMSLAAIGIAVAAVASIWVLAALDGVRRGPVFSLMADRGASRAQLALHAARTGAVVSVPPAVVAAAAACVSVPDARWRQTWVPVVAVALAVLVAVVIAATPGRVRVDVDRRRMRRVVLELLVVGAALGSVVLVRRRDSRLADAAGGDFDLTIAIVPSLIALAAGVVVLRMIGPIASVLARLAAGRPKLAWFVGARRLASQPAELRAPVAALVIAATVAVFASVVSNSLDERREFASWQSTGGDGRIDIANPDLRLPHRLLDEMRGRPIEPAFGATISSRRFAGAAGSFVADLVALDVAEYRALVASDVVADLVDAALGELSRAPAGPIPAVFVAGRARPTDPELGDVVRLGLGAFVVDVEIVREEAGFPGLPVGRSAILLDRHALAAVTDERTVAPTFVLFDDGPLTATAVDVLDDPRVLARVTYRADRLDALGGDPLATWTRRATWLLGAAALLLAVVTAAAAAVITSSARRRDLGLLAVLGLGGRSAARLVAIELLPGIVVATLGGAVAGLVAARQLGPSLSLDVFTGADTAHGVVDVVVSWPAVAVVVTALVISAAVAVGATVRSLRAVDHAMLLRRGDL